MPDSKISSLDALTSVATGDELVVVDKSDTTQAATGTTKKITQDNLIPDSTASVKGKAILASGQINGATAKTTPADADELGLVDTEASNVLKKLTIANLAKSVLATGWVDAGETWTYASADDPTYTFTISGDKTGKYSAGMRIKLTQTTDKYFIITKVAYSSPNTTVTIYGGTDYDLANATITSPYYSTQKAPLGFPLDPDKWTVEEISTTDRTTNTPTQNTWYNAESITIPIGIWDVSYFASSFSDRTAQRFISCSTTLSTANNSESNTNMTATWRSTHTDTTGSIAHSERVTASDIINLSAKDILYLNYKSLLASQDSIQIRGNADAPTIIRAVCAYL